MWWVCSWNVNDSTTVYLCILPQVKSTKYSFLIYMEITSLAYLGCCALSALTTVPHNPHTVWTYMAQWASGISCVLPWSCQALSSFSRMLSMNWSPPVTSAPQRVCWVPQWHRLVKVFILKSGQGALFVWMAKVSATCFVKKNISQWRLLGSFTGFLPLGSVYRNMIVLDVWTPSY